MEHRKYVELCRAQVRHALTPRQHRAERTVERPQTGAVLAALVAGVQAGQRAHKDAHRRPGGGWSQ